MHYARDIARGIPGARNKDDAMADARRILDWEAQYACALDPEKARNIRESRAQRRAIVKLVACVVNSVLFVA